MDISATMAAAQTAESEGKSFLDILQKQSVQTILFTLLIFLIGWFLIKYAVRLMDRVLSRHQTLDHSVRMVVLKALRAVLVFLLALTCADRLGLPTTSLLTLVGALGLAFSLALQSSLSNLAGGIFILTTKPFVTGDYIEVAGQGGTVTQIGFIHTRLNTIENKQIYIPNGTVSSSTITNYSHEDRRQLDINIPVPYDCSLKEARKVIETVVSADERVLETPYIRTWDLNASAVNIKVRVWCLAKDLWELRSALLENIKIELDEAHISIPFDQLDVHLKQ
ncbi:MAG: mechanosensitive ion channel family protein [Clostridiaceae bacterium]|nr:mechanosensitive ion channel family protein [Clostridiaceae bacterium]